MSLTYLSGDGIGKGRKNKAKSGGGGGSKPAKQKRSKAEKKQARKRVKKKVAKVAIAPARAAFLTVVRLNLLKTATKMVRVWKSPGGKEDITKFWDGFGGDPNKLKQAIIKGSKQTISGSRIGATAEIIATATPILVAIAKLFKKHRAEGSPAEAKEYDQGIETGMKTLDKDESVPKSEVSMPANKDVGIVADKNGDSVHDPGVANQPESKSGGTDSELPPGGYEKGSGKSAADGGKDSQAASNWHPLGFFFMLLMYTMLSPSHHPDVPGMSPDHARLNDLSIFDLMIGLIQTYCLTAILFIPVALSNRTGKLHRLAYLISFAPMNFINRTLNKNNHGSKKATS